MCPSFSATILLSPENPVHMPIPLHLCHQIGVSIDLAVAILRTEKQLAGPREGVKAEWYWEATKRPLLAQCSLTSWQLLFALHVPITVGVSFIGKSLFVWFCC